LALLVVLTSMAAGVGLMLLARRRSPRGGFFHETERVIGILGFAGTSFSVLLAFVFFLAFESYAAAKVESGHEADAVFEQFRIAALFDSPDRDALQSELICYARSVVSDEWTSMKDGELSARVDTWVVQIEHSVDAVAVDEPMQVTAFDKFFDETIAREGGRRARLQEAEGVVPAPMWIVLMLGAAGLIAYTLMLADSGERRFVQCSMVTAVALFAITPLLLINFLDHPFSGSAGSIHPSAMQFTLTSMERQRTATTQPPCDTIGQPSAARAQRSRPPAPSAPLALTLEGVDVIVDLERWPVATT
jgi:hypothetical protein